MLFTKDHFNTNTPFFGEEMGSLQKEKPSCSWLLGSHNTSYQSQWLQSTLSELDEKTKGMLALIEDEGDTFAQRAEMYYKKRPELVKMLEEFHKSYRSLAERYDQHLRYESARINPPGFHSNIPIDGTICNGKGSSPDLIGEEDSDVTSNKDKLEVVYLDKVVDEIDSTQEKDDKADNVVGLEAKDVDEEVMDARDCQNKEEENAILNTRDRESMWENLRSQVSILMEDNLRQQYELIKRNDEKRQAIKDLYFHLDKVMDENKTLLKCMKCSKVGMKQSQSQMSKFKALVLGKILGGNS